MPGEAKVKMSRFDFLTCKCIFQQFEYHNFENCSVVESCSSLVWFGFVCYFFGGWGGVGGGLNDLPGRRVCLGDWG